MTHKHPAIQRTLVLTSGELGKLVAAAFDDTLTAVPCPAIAITHLDTPNVDTALPIIKEQLTHISHTTIRQQLAALGWQLSHSGEIALIVLGDTQANLEPLIQATQRLIQTGFGSSVTTLRFTFAAVPSQANRPQRALTADPTSRGHYLLSPFNQLGLQLPPETIAPHIAQMLHQLITTPLRTAPEQLQEQTSYLQPGYAAMGVASWCWSADESKQQLVERWLTAVLQAWQQPRESTSNGSKTGSVSPESSQSTDPVSYQAWASAWLTQQAIAPDQLAPQLALLASPVATPAWHVPQPWELPNWVRQQQQLAAVLQTPQADAVQQAIEAIEPEETLATAENVTRVATRATRLSTGEFQQTLTATCQALLDEQPVGGLALVNYLLQMVSAQLAQLTQQTADQQDNQADTAAQHHDHLTTLLAQMEELLTPWPGMTPLAWLKPLLQPWRWPKLAWHYWQLHALGQQVVQLLQQQAQLEWEQVTTAVLHHLYTTFQHTTRHLSSQAEELADMLTALQPCAEAPSPIPSRWEGDQIPPPLGEARWGFFDEADLITTLHNQLIESPLVEATLAAEAIGGLGQQLCFPDDVILDRLRQLGEERLAAIDEKTAVDLLLLHHPTADSLHTWWESQYEDAAPLWHYDEANCSDLVRSQTSSLTLVATADALTLRDQLQLPAEANVQWLPSSDRQQITVLRLQSGIPALS